MIIGITGTNGAGKGIVVDYLVNKKGFRHFSSSGLLGEELKRRGLEQTRTNMRMVGNEFREKYGGGYLVEEFLRRAKEENISNFIIESIRSTGEAQALKEAGGRLLVVDADRKIRYERIFARRSGKDRVDYDTFVEQEEREWYGAEGVHDMNIKSVIRMADYTIENNDSLDHLYTDVEAFIKKTL